MKSILLAITLIVPLNAAQFDTEGFGQKLNGWKKNRTTQYELTDATYRTYMPTITATPGGGMFLTTQVDLITFGGVTAVSHIDMAFSAGGTLLSAQLRSTIQRKTIDTGLVRRPETPMIVEGETTRIDRTFNPTDELIIDLFSRYDMEIKRVWESKDAEKRDLFSRFSSKGAKNVNLPAALRHNINLMLQFVSP